MTTTKEMIEAQAKALASSWPAEKREVVEYDLRLMASFIQSPEYLKAWCAERIEELEGRNIDIRKALGEASIRPDGPQFLALTREHRQNSHMFQAYQILMQRMEAL